MTARRLILVRHGNTFEAGQTPVMVGAHEDLPLTTQGIAQAHALAAAIAARGEAVAQIATSPLARTLRTAQIIAAALPPLTPTLDERLRELDYGAWSGLSDAAIIARGDEAALLAWRQRGQWPSVFVGSDAEVSARVRSVADELPGGTSVIVSSQGILRYFLQLVPGAFARAAASDGLKVSTGAYCVLRLGADAAVEAWNVLPA